MTREEDIDREMLKGFYFAYKDGTKHPGSVRDLKNIKATGDEFVDSQRRLMQGELLDGTTTRVRIGTLYSADEISDLGIQTYENNNVDPLLRGMETFDPGFGGKKYRLLKWFRENPKYIVGSIAIPIIAIIIGIIV